MRNLILVACLFAAVFSLRAFQWFYGVEYIELDGYQVFKSILKDLLLTMQLFTLSSVIAFVFRVFRRDPRRIVLHAVHVIMLLANFLLIVVFLKTKMPVDETVYRFNWVELKIITSGESKLDLSWLLFFGFTLCIYFGLYRFGIKRVRKEIQFPVQSVAIVSAIVLTVLVSLINKHEINSVSSDNMLSYFAQRSIVFAFENKERDQKIPSQAIAEMNRNFFGGERISPHYPFLHELPEQSKLGKYLNKSKNGPPNIVYIIVESLSSDFVGKYAHRTGHIMPFLDSLSGKSLYWPNALSSYSRTVHVLPASLASVPFTSNGAHFQSLDYPNHASLVSLLKESHYSRFYCGAHLDFSDMRKYMNYHQTDYLVTNWESQFSKFVDGLDNMWGYPDGQVFEKSWLDDAKQNRQDKKRFDVFLTCTTHAPFAVPGKAKYARKVNAQVERIKSPNDYQKSMAENASSFAAFSYVDDQLRRYFERARKQQDFENTIYVIFGDHSSELTYNDALSYFKIPILIYSPLVKKPQQFNNIASQLDLPPTLLNYLRNEYQLELPGMVSFMGRELPFEKQVRHNRSLMLGFVGRKNKSFLENDFYLFDNELFKIDQNLNPTKVNNDAQRDKMLRQIENAEKIMDYVIYNNAIVPENLFLEFYKHKKNKKIHDFEFAKVQKMNGEYLDVGPKIPYKPSHKFIYVKISYDIKPTENMHAKDLPPLVLTIDRNSKNIFWSQLPYQDQTVYKNQWTHMKATGIFRISEIKGLRANDLINHYLWNQKLQKHEMKNLRYTVSYL